MNIKQLQQEMADEVRAQAISMCREEAKSENVKEMLSRFKEWLEIYDLGGCVDLHYRTCLQIEYTKEHKSELTAIYREHNHVEPSLSSRVIEFFKPAKKRDLNDDGAELQELKSSNDISTRPRK